jgi:hypothetical protein
MISIHRDHISINRIALNQILLKWRRSKKGLFDHFFVQNGQSIRFTDSNRIGNKSILHTMGGWCGNK